MVPSRYGMEKIVHMVWVGSGVLSLMSRLTVSLWIRRGFTPHIWSYGGLEDVPRGVVLRDACEVLPRESLFTFQGYDKNISNGGKGSYAHWSDIFQMRLLRMHGGWYSQFDVAPLEVPECEYYFADHGFPGVVNTFVMRVPRGSPFLDACIVELESKVNASTASEIGWYDGMGIIGSHVAAAGLGGFVSPRVMECGCGMYTKGRRKPPAGVEFVHWCNSCCPNQGALLSNTSSFYFGLLRKEGLIPPPPRRRWFNPARYGRR